MLEHVIEIQEPFIKAAALKSGLSRLEFYLGLEGEDKNVKHVIMS